MNFNERASAFWSEFQSESKNILNTFQDSPHKAFEIIVPIMDKVLASPVFEIGGPSTSEKLEINFSTRNHTLNLFLIEQLLKFQLTQQQDFLFNKYIPRKEAIYKTAQLAIGDEHINFSDLKLRFDWNEESKKFECVFYLQAFNQISEDQCFEIISIILEQALGQLWISQFIYIDSYLVEDDDSFVTLDNLVDAIEQKILENGLPKSPSFIEKYMSYNLEGLDKNNRFVRSDTIMGITRLSDLLDDYLQGVSQGEDGIYQTAMNLGAFPCFISFAHNNQNAVDTRYDIEDQLIELLEHNNLAHLLGGATGEKNCYIDLIIYDKPATIKILQDYFGKIKKDALLYPFIQQATPETLYKNKKFFGLF